MAKIRSTIDSSESTSPTASTVTAYASGNTPVQVVLGAGEQVTLAGINGGNPITTSPFNFTYNSTTFPSGINPVVTSGTPSLSQSTLSFGSSTSTLNIINWTSVSNATSYVLKRSLNADMSSATTIYTGALLTYTDTGLTASTTYYYTITASAVGYNSSTSAVANKTTSASVTTYELTVNVTGLADTYEVYVNGELWVNHKKAFAVGTVLTDLVPSVTGFTLSPTSVASVTMDANKSIDFTATPVSSDPNLLSGFTYLDLVNDLQAGGFEPSKRPTETSSGSHRWYPLSSGAFWLSNKLLATGSQYACRITAGDLFLLGSNAAPANLFEQRGMDYEGSGTLKVNDGGTLSAPTTQQPAVGDWLRITVLASSMQVDYSSNGTTWNPITLPTNFVNPNGKYIAGQIYASGFLSYPQYKL